MPNLANQSKSINWINAVKALCIILVFFRHSENYYGYHLGRMDSLFLPIYVNAFFFVSGYLLFWKQLSEPRILEGRRHFILTGGGKSLIMNILYRIIIPSIIFSIIEFVPSCLMHGRGIDIGFALYKTIGGGTYWFTSALVVSELILLGLFCSRKRNIWFYVIFCVLLGFAGLVIVRLGILQNGLWAWRQGLIALVFLAMGGLYWRYEKEIDTFRKWWFVIPLLSIYTMLVIFCENTDPLISTLNIQPLGFLTSAMGCLLFVWLCKCLPEMKHLTFIGQNSLGFYFLSGALPITLSLVAHKMIAGTSFWLLLMIWAVCMVIAYVSVQIINRWLPWLWDLRKLNKA